MNSGPKLTPCFIPVRIVTPDGSHKVNLTRVGVERGQLSGDAPVEAGQTAELELHRPTDGQLIRVGIEVKSVRREGAQWGWMPAIHVDLACSFDECAPHGGTTSGYRVVIEDPSSTTSPWPR